MDTSESETAELAPIKPLSATDSRQGRTRTLIFIALAAALTALLGSVLLVRGQSTGGGKASVANAPDGLSVSWSKSGQGGDGMSALVKGTLVREADCLLLVAENQSVPVVWPFGTFWDDSTATLHLADGTDARIGDQLSGGGGFESLDAVSATVGPDQAKQLRPCASPVAGDQVAVFNPDEVLAIN